MEIQKSSKLGRPRHNIDQIRKSLSDKDHIEIDVDNKRLKLERKMMVFSMKFSYATISLPFPIVRELGWDKDTELIVTIEQKNVAHKKKDMKPKLIPKEILPVNEKQ